MIVRVLGTSAGGGCPQWNCACPVCRLTRRPDSPVRGRTQSSIAVSGDGARWYLIDVGPDVRAQVEATPELWPGPGVRATPIAGAVLTDAQLDHVLGLAVLREGSDFRVLGTAEVLGALDGPLPLSRVLSHFGRLAWEAVAPREAVALGGGLRVALIPVGDRPPRFAAGAQPGAWACAARIDDGATGGAVVYAPAVGHWSPELLELFATASVVFVDGTFWTEEEMITSGVGSRTASSMGHLPISGPLGTARRLTACEGPRFLYTHINNTNPVLDPDSPQRADLAAMGLEVAEDGMEVRA